MLLPRNRTPPRTPPVDWTRQTYLSFESLEKVRQEGCRNPSLVHLKTMTRAVAIVELQKEATNIQCNAAAAAELRMQKNELKWPPLPKGWVPIGLQMHRLFLTFSPLPLLLEIPVTLASRPMNVSRPRAID